MKIRRSKLFFDKPLGQYKLILLLLVLNLGLSFVVFRTSLPIEAIPSDDRAFARSVEELAICLKGSWACAPEVPAYFYMKPSYLYLTGVLHYSFGQGMGYSSLETMALMSLICAALSAVIVQLLLMRFTRIHGLAILVGFVLFWGNETVWGVHFWWGYSHFISLWVQLSLVACLIMIDYLAEFEENGEPGFFLKLAVWASVFVLSAALAFYTHLAAVPAIVTTVGLLALIPIIPWLRKIALVLVVSLNPSGNRLFGWVGSLLIPLHPAKGPARLNLKGLYLAVFLSIVLVSVIYYINEFGPEPLSFLEIYRRSLEINHGNTSDLRQHFAFWFHATIPLFYLLIEWPLTTFALLGCFFSLIGGKFSFQALNSRAGRTFLFYGIFC